MDTTEVDADALWSQFQADEEEKENGENAELSLNNNVWTSFRFSEENPAPLHPPLPTPPASPSKSSDINLTSQRIDTPVSTRHPTLIPRFVIIPGKRQSPASTSKAAAPVSVLMKKAMHEHASSESGHFSRSAGIYNLRQTPQQAKPKYEYTPVYLRNIPLDVPESVHEERKPLRLRIKLKKADTPKADSLASILPKKILHKRGSIIKADSPQNVSQRKGTPRISAGMYNLRQTPQQAKPKHEYTPVSLRNVPLALPHFILVAGERKPRQQTQKSRRQFKNVTPKRKTHASRASIFPKKILHKCGPSKAASSKNILQRNGTPGRYNLRLTPQQSKPKHDYTTPTIQHSSKGNAGSARKVPSPLRKRKNLNPSQTLTLKDSFELNDRPDKSQMEKLAKKLDLDFKVIKTWFANRRQKARKETSNVIKEVAIVDILDD